MCRSYEFHAIGSQEPNVSEMTARRGASDSMELCRGIAARPGHPSARGYRRFGGARSRTEPKATKRAGALLGFPWGRKSPHLQALKCSRSSVEFRSTGPIHIRPAGCQPVANLPHSCQEHRPEAYSTCAQCRFSAPDAGPPRSRIRKRWRRWWPRGLLRSSPTCRRNAQTR